MMLTMKLHVFSCFATVFLVHAADILVSSTEVGQRDRDKKEPDRSDFLDEADTSNWIDPQQMKFPIKPSKNVALQTGGDATLAEKCQPLLRSATSQQQITFLRHIFRPFVSTIHAAEPHAQVLDVSMRIRRDAMLEFERLFEASGSDSAKVLDAWKELIRTLSVAKEPTSVETVERLLGVEMRLILMVLVITAIPVFIIYVESKLRLSLMMLLVRILKYALVIGFIISIPWTWLRLYQEKVAEQQRQLMERDQAHCKPLSVWRTLGRFVSNKFSMLPESSPCEKYYRAINVHPYLDVPFTSAIAVTFTQFVTEPLKLIGKGFGEFFQHLLAPLPFYMWPVMMISFLLITFFLIIVRSNYKIHLPYFFARIEPSHPPPVTPAVERTTDQMSRMALEDMEERARRARSSISLHDKPRRIGYGSALRPRMLGYGTKRSKSHQLVRRRDDGDQDDWEPSS